MSTVRTAEWTLASRASAYVALTKPDVSFLVILTTAAGYYMAVRGPVNWLSLIHTVFATALIAAGTAALNHYAERESDRYMRRTASRPLPSGTLERGAWLLFAILFLWQFPHFHAIAWIYREDYARAGILMLPVVDQEGKRTFRQIILYAAALLAVSLLPTVMGLAGIRYFFGAMVVSTALLQVCLWAATSKTNVRAKWLMHATVLHIPLLLGLMAYDKIPR